MATAQVTTTDVRSELLLSNLTRNGFIVNEPSLAEGIICAEYDDLGFVVPLNLVREFMISDDRELNGLMIFIDPSELDGVELTRERISERSWQGE